MRRVHTPRTGTPGMLMREPVSGRTGKRAANGARPQRGFLQRGFGHHPRDHRRGYPGSKLCELQAYLERDVRRKEPMWPASRRVALEPGEPPGGQGEMGPGRGPIEDLREPEP